MFGHECFTPCDCECCLGCWAPHPLSYGHATFLRYLIQPIMGGNKASSHFLVVLTSQFGQIMVPCIATPFFWLPSYQIHIVGEASSSELLVLSNWIYLKEKPNE